LANRDHRFGAVGDKVAASRVSRTSDRHFQGN
jgi:hypothetical protein